MERMDAYSYPPGPQPFNYEFNSDEWVNVAPIVPSTIDTLVEKIESLYSWAGSFTQNMPSLDKFRSDIVQHSDAKLADRLCEVSEAFYNRLHVVEGKAANLERLERKYDELETSLLGKLGKLEDQVRATNNLQHKLRGVDDRLDEMAEAAEKRFQQLFVDMKSKIESAEATLTRDISNVRDNGEASVQRLAEDFIKEKQVRLNDHEELSSKVESLQELKETVRGVGDVKALVTMCSESIKLLQERLSSLEAIGPISKNEDSSQNSKALSRAEAAIKDLEERLSNAEQNLTRPKESGFDFSSALPGITARFQDIDEKMAADREKLAAMEAMISWDEKATDKTTVSEDADKRAFEGTLTTVIKKMKSLEVESAGLQGQLKNMSLELERMKLSQVSGSSDVSVNDVEVERMVSKQVAGLVKGFRKDWELGEMALKGDIETLQRSSSNADQAVKSLWSRLEGVTESCQKDLQEMSSKLRSIRQNENDVLVLEDKLHNQEKKLMSMESKCRSRYEELLGSGVTTSLDSASTTPRSYATSASAPMGHGGNQTMRKENALKERRLSDVPLGVINKPVVRKGEKGNGLQWTAWSSNSSLHDEINKQMEDLENAVGTCNKATNNMKRVKSAATVRKSVDPTRQYLTGAVSVSGSKK